MGICQRETAKWKTSLAGTLPIQANHRSVNLNFPSKDDNNDCAHEVNVTDAMRLPMADLFLVSCQSVNTLLALGKPRENTPGREESPLGFGRSLGRYHSEDHATRRHSARDNGVCKCKWVHGGSISGVAGQVV